MSLQLSSKQLADLVGVSVRTLRHYHAIGILPEPSRKSNNYRVYGLEHVLQVLRIRRLSEFGLSLEMVKDALDDPERRFSEELLRQLDQEFAAQIALLTARRNTIGEMLRTGEKIDVLPEYAQYLKDLRELGESDQELELYKILIELVGSVGHSRDAGNLKGTLSALIENYDARRFQVLDDRFYTLGPESSNDEIEALAADYVKIALELVSLDESEVLSEENQYNRRANPLNSLIADLVSRRFNAQQQLLLERVEQSLPKEI